MSHQLGRVVSEILQRYFGEIVQQVGKDLFSFGSRPVAMIVKSTGLPRNQVIESLRTLIKFNLATFEPSNNEVIADYKLVPENVLLLIRYPRYLLQIKTKYGSEAELLVEELLQQAKCSSTLLLVTIANKYKNDKEKNLTMVQLKDTFISLATAGYIQQSPVEETKEGANEVPTLVPVATIVPDLDTRALIQAMAKPEEITDKIYWEVNYDRFHQDFRDEIMIKAISRRIDDHAGELMRLLLQQMCLTSPAWAAVSTPTPAVDLKHSCRRTAADSLLTLHLDHYLKVLEENGAGFVERTGDAGGGRLAVRGARAAARLVAAALEHAVTERLGSNAARILRLIMSKKYIEEDDIQKYAMLPNKECKQLTYKLLEEHFISVQPMRKAASAGGLAKTIYLYHVKLHEAAHTCKEMCYRSLHNVLRRSRTERAAASRLLDKQRRVRSIVHGMRVRGEPQQNITDVEETLTPPELAVLASVEKRIKQLSTAELELDKTLFILNWYFMYPH
ncbi:DNA-directed RNA polymerase III subunit RPC3 [Amyelois transitella]|uniref:DNA-directed RNA polymerase III subunit RPC3 n=1 Tax=Amyelois transitella TaxID=680683 RepID=UPI00067D6C91|nr:DNA-directed RNA polymerase III subunit RPC3 [Amyelois transitella]